MKAEELVGKWIESEVLTDELNVSAGTAFRVVGYNSGTNWAIVDAWRKGWKRLFRDDIIAEKCETYWYLRLCEITKVL